MIQVYCSGNLVADVQAKTLTQFPGVDEVAMVDEIELVLGGNAANAAVCLARMGVQTGVIGRIGDDFFGQFVRDTLADAGVDTTLMIAAQGAKTAATVAAIDPEGRRRCAHVPGATSQFTAQDFAWETLAHNRAATPTSSPVFLHFGSFFLLPGFNGPTTAQVLAQARHSGLQTSLDVCWDPNGRWAEEVAPCLEFCDITFPNLTEAQHITNLRDPAAMAQWFLDRGVGTAVIKLGDGGCLVKTATEHVRVPAYPVKVIDATGAGDAFAAGFLAARVWQWDLERSARFACALAGISVTGFGVATALQSPAQVLALMER